MTWTEAEAALRSFIVAQWASSGLAADMPLAFENDVADYSERFMAIEIEGVWAEKTLYGGAGLRSSVQGGIVFLHAFVPTASGKAAAINAIDVLTRAIELQTLSNVINLEGGAPPSPVAYGDVDREIPAGQPGGNYYRCSGSVPFIVIGTI
jgi:hypothetical protein